MVLLVASKKTRAVLVSLLWTAAAAACPYWIVSNFVYWLPHLHCMKSAFVWKRVLVMTFDGPRVFQSWIVFASSRVVFWVTFVPDQVWQDIAGYVGYVLREV